MLGKTLARFTGWNDRAKLPEVLVPVELQLITDVTAVIVTQAGSQDQNKPAGENR